jgi:RsiW-degrading membrane proteinase PrsW (M82 family)
MLVEGTHWGLALVPVLVLLALFVWLDAFKLMSLPEVLGLLVLGGLAALAAWPVAGRFLDTLPIGFSIYSRFIAPWIEEAIKAVAIVALFRLNKIGYKLDAVIAGFAIGAGFSVVENIVYLLRFPEYGGGTWLVRGLGTAIMHGGTLAILAAAAHEFAERETRAAAGEFDFHLWWFIPGYLAAVALHTLFNQFPGRPLLAMMGAMVVVPLALIAVLNFGTAEAERWLAAERATHQVQLESLRAGRWPDGPAAARIAALAGRVDAQTAQRMGRYWELQAWLVVQAEAAMMDEVEGDVTLDSAAIRAAFAELAGLRAAIGRSTFAAFKALLPFSRNDYWEVAELRQRIGRAPTKEKP